MKTFLAGFITGCLLIIFIVFFHPKPEDDKVKDVTVTQISGDPIGHSGFVYKGSNIKFTTEAEGKGVIITEIPKTNIPEARYWIENNNAVAFEILSVDKRMYGISYLRRWSNFSVGGGILISEQRFEGIKAQAQYWFKL
jgi:hypothetical protein